MYLLGSPVAQVETDLIFETHQQCIRHVLTKWNGQSTNPQIEIHPECRIGI